MAKKGGKKHLKRKPAPQFWQIHRKEHIWTVKPKPGSHPILRGMPLLLIVREMLGFAKNRKEARTIISQGKVKVDGKTQLEEKFSVGLMDVISIPEIEKVYRVIPSEKGLILHQIGKEEKGLKLCRIEKKTLVEGGHMQLNLHDGRNILIQIQDPKKTEEDIYQTLDTLMISLPSQEILEYIKLAEDTTAIIIDGKNIGRYGKIVSIEKKPGQKRRKALVTIEDQNGEQLQTILNFIFVIGEDRPSIILPGVS